MKSALLLPLVLAAASLSGCGEKAPAPHRDGKPVVTTTFYPVTYFAERIGGDLIEVVCPVPEGEDAIFWNPDAGTLGRYQASDLILINGAGFEKWVEKVSLPTTRVVNTTAGLEADLIRFEETMTHSHGPAGEHTHAGLDGHTWLDPMYAKVQARAVHDALARLLPGAEDTLKIRRDALLADLDGLHEALRAEVEAYEGETILASHPAYNYIARRYGWKLVNLDLDPGEMPSDQVVAATGALVESNPARFILWESAPTGEIAARFREELGLESVVFSPCELLSAGERADGADYLSVMGENIDRARPVFLPRD